MSDLDPTLRQRLVELTTREPVVLFMKGTRQQPHCGFSARTVEILGRYLQHFDTFNILEDEVVREGLKAFADWPTFPQLWVNGELVGGSDIIATLHQNGELAEVLGADVQPIPVPKVTITEAAAARIKEVTHDPSPALRLVIDADFNYSFEGLERIEPGDVQVTQWEMSLVMDPGTAGRAEGMTLDFATGDDGASLVVDNPNAPGQPKLMQVEDLAIWLESDKPLHLVDVRTEQEWNLAHLPQARFLDEEAAAFLDGLDKDAPIAFICHHGGRSQQAAEHFARLGFTDVYNVVGGMDAWSVRVDPKVPRY